MRGIWMDAPDDANYDDIDKWADVPIRAEAAAAALRSAADETEQRAEQVWNEVQSDRGEIIAQTLRHQAKWLRERANAEVTA